jgi:hypothetical protein
MGEDGAGERAEGTQQRTPGICNVAGPLRGCTSPGFEKGAIGTQNGATPEKATHSEPPTRSRTRVLELARISPRDSRAARLQ